MNSDKVSPTETTDSISAAIATSILGQDLTREECDKLSIAVTKRSLQKDEILFHEDSKDETLYLLMTGKLEVLKTSGNNQIISIDTLKPGSMTGELSFLDGESHTMRLVAKKPTEVLMLHKQTFEKIVEKEPMLTYHVMRSILRYSHKIQRKINSKYLEMHRMVQNQYTAH